MNQSGGWAFSELLRGALSHRLLWHVKAAFDGWMENRRKGRKKQESPAPRLELLLLGDIMDV